MINKEMRTYGHIKGTFNIYKNCQPTDFRQAREANICLTREGRHMTPGLSLNMKISSSISAGPNVQFLLVG